MTKDRREIEIEGSADGIDWVPYEFKWKPGDVKRATRLVCAASAAGSTGRCGSPHWDRLEKSCGSTTRNLFARRQNGCDATLCAQSFSGKTTAIHPGRFLSIQIYNHRRTSRNGRVVETTRTRRILADDLARANFDKIDDHCSPLRDASSVSKLWRCRKRSRS